MSTLKVNTITPLSGDTVTVSGSLTTTGKLIIGDATNDTVVFSAEVSSSIIPDANNTYDLGSPTKVWREIYVSSESLNFVDDAGNSTKFTKDNVDKIKAGKPIATIGGYESSTRTKAIFQDDDETTYKKMTIPGRVSQFMSGALVKDYNKSGDNSYSKKDGIETYEWNNALSMSFNTSNSIYNVQNMSMDITAGGFFGIGVSGSTYASNLAQIYMDFVQSGSFVSTGSTTFLVSESSDVVQITGSEGNTLNVSGGNVVITSEFTQSGESVFEGGTTTINGTAQTQSLIVSGGQIQFEVEDSGSSFEISGSEGDTLNVSGGNVVITSEFTQSGESVFEGGTTTINGTAQTQSLIVSGGQIQFEVQDPTSSFEISGSEGTTLNVSGGNVVITSEFTQSGESVFEGGTTTFNNSGSFNDTGSFTGSMDDIATEISGNLGVVGSIDQVFTNNVPITSSLTLTNATHGMGRQLLVRSGSTPVYSSGISEGLPTLHYPNGGRYLTYSPGEIILTLPAADIGLSFHIINKAGFDSSNLPGYAFKSPPTLKLTPSGTNKFIYGAGGSAGVAGKAIINHSSSYSNGDYAVVSCVSQSHWMVQQMGGTWIDEA